jgi:hypothetical protein
MNQIRPKSRFTDSFKRGFPMNRIRCLMISLLLLPLAAFAQADARFVELNFQFEQQGQPLMAPSMLVAVGVPASITLSNDAGIGHQLDATVTSVHVDDAGQALVELNWALLRVEGQDATPLARSMIGFRANAPDPVTQTFTGPELDLAVSITHRLVTGSGLASARRQ